MYSLNQQGELKQLTQEEETAIKLSAQKALLEKLHKTEDDNLKEFINCIIKKE